MPGPVSETAKTIAASPRDCRLRPPRAQSDAARLRELHAVADKIDQHLPQARRIDHHRPRQVAADLDGDIDALGVGAAGKQLGDFLKQGLEVGRFGVEVEAPGLDLGEIEHVVDERQQRLAGGMDGAGVGRLVGRQGRLGEEVGQARGCRSAACGTRG